MCACVSYSDCSTFASAQCTPFSTECGCCLKRWEYFAFGLACSARDIHARSKTWWQWLGTLISHEHRCSRDLRIIQGLCRLSTFSHAICTRLSGRNGGYVQDILATTTAEQRTESPSSDPISPAPASPSWRNAKATQRCHGRLHSCRVPTRLPITDRQHWSRWSVSACRLWRRR
jgi:hypothetical protein